jgi:hypothetical protein
MYEVPPLDHDRAALLLAKLQALATVDDEHELFGARSHRYRLRPALGAATIAHFERVHHLELPPDYRAFLQLLGDGGAGPGYGLSPLQPWNVPAFYCEIGSAPSSDKTRPALIRDSEPSRPFPFEEEWIVPQTDDPLELPGEANPYDGCLLLSEMGYGTQCFLVVAGAAAGEVWYDTTPADGALAPSGQSFATWYEAWLDEQIRMGATSRIYDQIEHDPHWTPLPRYQQLRPYFEQWLQRGRRDASSHVDCGLMALYGQDLRRAEELLGRGVWLADGNDADSEPELETILEVVAPHERQPSREMPPLVQIGIVYLCAAAYSEGGFDRALELCRRLHAAPSLIPLYEHDANWWRALSHVARGESSQAWEAAADGVGEEDEENAVRQALLAVLTGHATKAQRYLESAIAEGLDRGLLLRSFVAQCHAFGHTDPMHG